MTQDQGAGAVPLSICGIAAISFCRSIGSTCDGSISESVCGRRKIADLPQCMHGMLPPSHSLCATKRACSNHLEAEGPRAFANTQILLKVSGQDGIATRRGGDRHPQHGVVERDTDRLGDLRYVRAQGPSPAIPMKPSIQPPPTWRDTMPSDSIGIGRSAEK